MECHSLRREWGPYCDHWSAHPPMATWYSECKRLRVSYLVDGGVMKLFVARGAKWMLECTVVTPSVTLGPRPIAARSWAYVWLAAEARARFPEKAQAVVNPVGCRHTKPPRTVRR